MKRRRMGKKHSRRSFKKSTGVQKVNNMNRAIMRGGIRL